MAGSKQVRILVHLRKNSRSLFRPAEFAECLLESLGFSVEEGLVKCHLENNKLCIENSALSTDSAAVVNTVIPDGKERINEPMPNLTNVKFRHPPFCPIHSMSAEEVTTLPQDIAKRGVDVGVAALVESMEGSVLVTRRAPHMRTFPGVWVPPGGHIEDGESLEQAVLREVEEETGLIIKNEMIKSSNILGLWESVYPPLLYMGQPKRHHVVVYMRIALSVPCTVLQAKLKLNPEEVDGSLWLTRETVKMVVHGSQDAPKQDLLVTTVDRNGEHATHQLDPKVIQEKIPAPGSDVERLSTGTRYALKLWLEAVHPELMAPKPSVNKM
ncbi:m7GpppN-mRNA hydrolase NUDT17-like [Oratosquilla oratoria]|uniref:m7GpppN-mRNA hydrolase NUDT17-like n=1 Tax=Oratosquilla oratoria TaxID=337810 RepID=UPI003F76B20E